MDVLLQLILSQLIDTCKRKNDRNSVNCTDVEIGFSVVAAESY